MSLLIGVLLVILGIGHVYMFATKKLGPWAVYLGAAIAVIGVILILSILTSVW